MFSRESNLGTVFPQPFKQFNEAIRGTLLQEQKRQKRFHGRLLRDKAVLRIYRHNPTPKHNPAFKLRIHELRKPGDSPLRVPSGQHKSVLTASE